MSCNKLEHLQEEIASFAEKYILPGVAERFQNYEFPREVFNKLGEAGFLRNGFPSRYGGNDTGARHFTALLEEVARFDSSAAVMLIPVYQAGQAVLKFGSEEQKKTYLAGILKGEKVGAFAVTEAGAGSDIRALKTRAEKVDGGYLINGQKAHITNALDADIFIVFAQADEGLSAFIAERGIEGFSPGDKEASIGFRAGYHGGLVFKDCFMPGENLLGEPGQGLKVALGTLNFSRIGAASVCIGIARAAVEDAIAYARDRALFDRKLVDFQGQRWRIAELLTEIEAGIQLRNHAAEKMEEGQEVAKEASMAKLFCSRTAVKAALEAIQIAGAHGVMENEAYQRYLLDAKSYEIAGGSSETLLNTVANFTLGKPTKV